eukprot:s2905_g2.t1
MHGAYGPQLPLVTRWFPLAPRLFCVAGVAFGDIGIHFVWQAWRLATWTFTLCGRHGTQAWHLWRLAGSCDALGSRWRRGSFAWQAWRLATWTFTLCVALGDMDLHFVWQAWRLWHSAGSCEALGSRWRRGSFAWQAWHLVPSPSLCVADMDLHFVWSFTLCGRRGTYRILLALVTRLGHGFGRRCARRHGLTLCVAAVTLGHMDLRFVWQAWHLATWAFTLCGKRVACGDMGLHFVWQAWPLWPFAGSRDALRSRGRRVTFCGRRGIWRHGPSLCVAGVVLGDMDFHKGAPRHFLWQAWHLETSTTTLCGKRGAWKKLTFNLCGRRGTDGIQLALVTRLVPVGAAALLRGKRGIWRGTYGIQLALVIPLAPRLFCVAGVAFGDIDLHFVWQPWRLTTWAFTLCVALGDMDLHFVWQAWHLATWTFTLCGRRGAYGTQLAIVTRLTPVGVAFGDIALHFMSQAWYLVTWTFTLCGRRGAYGAQLPLVTRLVLVGAAVLARGRRGFWRDAWRHGPSLCVAGVAFGDMDLHFVWQAWHLVTWTFILCKRGAYGAQLALVTRLGGGGASLCVAGVALGDMDLHFVWQAEHLATWTFTLCGRRGTCGIQLALVTRLGPGSVASLCVAAVALGDMGLRCVWQAWRLWRSAGSCDALGPRAAPRHFVWQAWHLATSTFTLCRKRGAW